MIDRESRWKMEMERRKMGGEVKGRKEVRRRAD